MIHANSNDARRFKRFTPLRINNEARRFATAWAVPPGVTVAKVSGCTPIQTIHADSKEGECYTPSQTMPADSPPPAAAKANAAH
jgi:hypothetical protein